MPGKRVRTTHRLAVPNNTGGGAAARSHVSHPSKKPRRRRSRRVLDATYGQFFTGQKATTSVLNSLQYVRAHFPTPSYNRNNAPNQWLLVIPAEIWTDVIIPFFGMKDLARARQINHAFFEPYWQDLFYRNKLPLRRPHDVPLNKLMHIGTFLSNLYTYAADDPLLVQIANGEHVADSYVRESDDSEDVVNYVSLNFAMALVGEDRDDTILVCGLLLTRHASYENYVSMKNLTVRKSER